MHFCEDQMTIKYQVNIKRTPNSTDPVLKPYCASPSGHTIQFNVVSTLNQHLQPFINVDSMFCAHWASTPISHLFQCGHSRNRGKINAAEMQYSFNTGYDVLFHGEYGLQRLKQWEGRTRGQRAITLGRIARSARIARSRGSRDF